jgi:hypothetical protein
LAIFAAICRAPSRINTVGPVPARFFGVSPVTAADVKTVYLSKRDLMDAFIGVDAVDNDEEILTLDVPDEALERAANVERQAFTWVYCTNGYYWYDCNWPQ